jgi:hypothetical protein
MPALVEPTQVGKREDLADMMTLLDAHETPISSMLKKGKEPANPLFGWPVDDLAKPTTEGVPEGKDVDTFQNAGENRKLVYGRIQRQWRNPMVGEIAENIPDVAGVGRKREYTESVMKKIRELKRDQEAVLGSANESQEGTTVDGYKTRGFQKWISSTAQTDLPVAEAYRTPSAAIDTTATASLTEANVQAVMAAIWKKTGKKSRFVMPCGSTLKQRFTNFSQVQPNVSSHTIIRSFNQNAERKAIVASVDVFEGDFGTIELIPSIFVGVDSNGDGQDDEGILIDPAFAEIRYNRLPQHRELENKGGGRRGVIDQIFALVVTHPQAHGKFIPA